MASESSEIAADIPARRSPARRRADPTREVKSARLLLWLIPTVVVGLVFGTRLLVLSSKVPIARRLASEIANRTKSAVRLGGLSFGWAYQPCVQHFELYSMHGDLAIGANTEEACVERWASAVGSGFRAVQIRLDHPSFLIQGSARGHGDKTLVDVQPTTSTQSAAVTVVRIRKDPLREFEVLFDDLHLDWRNLPVPTRIAQGRLGPLDGSVTIQKRGLQSAASIEVREPKSGLRITGRANPTPEGWDMASRLEGDLAPSFGSMLELAGIDIRKLPVEGELGMIYSSISKKLTVDVDLQEHDVDVANDNLSSKRLVNFTAHQKFRVDWDIGNSLLSIRDGLLEVNGIPTLFSLEIHPGLSSPAFTLRASLRTVPMAKLLRSVPGGEQLAMIDGMSPSVLFALTFTISGELRDPRTWQPKLEYRILGVGKNAEGSGLEFLLRPFDYYPLVADGRSHNARRIGPETPDWVPYAKIPYLARRAVQISEDADFFIHSGINIDEMRAAIVEGVETGKRTRGGSTLTQQLVKNLFLSRERTASRKIQEFFLTLLVESALPKERIFELYLNIIEWGPAVYGLKDASDYYFSRPPTALNPRELAYLTTIIPGPMLFHKYFESGRVSDKMLWKVNLLLDRMSKLGSIPAEELAGHQAEPIRFVHRTPRATTAPEKLPDINVPDPDSPE
jgi:hypothetical protein